MNHFSDIQSFFKDANIVLNARHEDDVEPEALKQHFDKLVSRIRIAKPTNGFANHDTGKPIGTNYQKTVAQAEISKKERELFWQKQKQEEEKRLEEEKIKTNNRNNEMKRLEKVNTVNNNHHESDESNNVNQVTLLRKERMDEAKSLISKNSISNARAFFEQNSSSTPSTVKTNVNNKIIDNISSHNNVNSIKNKLISDSNGEQKTQNHAQELPPISQTSQINKDNEEIDDIVEKMVEYDGVDDRSSSEESLPNQILTTEYQSYQTYFPEPRLLENIEEEQSICNCYC